MKLSSTILVVSLFVVKSSLFFNDKLEKENNI